MYGDTAVMRRRAGQLREQAVDVRAQAQALVAQAEGVPWTGRAAEAMRTRVRDRAARLREAAGLHDDAAESLERHLAEVDRLTEAIAAAERRHHDSTTGPAGATGDDDATTPPPGHRDWLSRDDGR